MRVGIVSLAAFRAFPVCMMVTDDTTRVAKTMSSSEERIPRPAVNTVRFRIAPSVAIALHLETIKRRARGALVTDVRFDFESKQSTRGEPRVTCSMAMAIFFIEELGALSAKAKARRDNSLVNDAARAVAATIKAIDDAERVAPVVVHSTSVDVGVERRA
jgi:hypothetical protein